MEFLEALASGGELTERQIGSARTAATTPQLAALCCRLASKQGLKASEAALLAELARRLPEGAAYLRVLYPRTMPPGPDERTPDAAIVWLLRQTSQDAAIGRDGIDRLIGGFVDGSVSADVVAIWLVKVSIDGLSDGDVRHLTEAMRDSGAIYDYRSAAELQQRKIVRRYPTGALSEKTALILPSLLAACRAEVPLASPFLVARSLGFTGGTWDKLRAIPGFVFPKPGGPSVQAMRQCGIAMTVTQDDVNPADRLLYQLRSATGTIESDELIVSSIASKQLCYPADLLLLDVRYGDGAFLRTQGHAHRVARAIKGILEAQNMETVSHYTDSPQPTGMAVGNAVEVLESLAAMGCLDADIWDESAIEEQRYLVATFFKILMEKAFGGERDWYQLACDMMRDGSALKAFADILGAHGVQQSTISSLMAEPSRVLLTMQPRVVVAPSSGILTGLNQRHLGHVVNFKLGAGGNDFVGVYDPMAGVVLAVRLGETISKGDQLCSVYGQASAEVLADVASCFEISVPDKGNHP